MICLTLFFTYGFKYNAPFLISTLGIVLLCTNLTLMYVYVTIQAPLTFEMFKEKKRVARIKEAKDSGHSAKQASSGAGAGGPMAKSGPGGGSGGGPSREPKTKWNTVIIVRRHCVSRFLLSVCLFACLN